MLLPYQIPKDQIIQPFDESLKNLIIFIFPKSSSKNFQMALDIAKSAKIFEESFMDNRKYFFCAFDFTNPQAHSAMALQRIICGWKGAYLFINNLPRDFYWFDSTMTCYLNSLITREPKYYCCTISSNFIKNDNRDWIHPCRKVLLQQSYYKMTSNNFIPLSDQLFAQAIKEHCEWCPNLTLSNLKPLEITNEIKDIQ